MYIKRRRLHVCPPTDRLAGKHLPTFGEDGGCFDEIAPRKSFEVRCATESHHHPLFLRFHGYVTREWHPLPLIVEEGWEERATVVEAVRIDIVEL